MSAAGAFSKNFTIGAGVPGLPAGTYTLMPSTYALLPGAFRVEINGAAAGNPAAGAQAPVGQLSATRPAAR